MQPPEPPKRPAPPAAPPPAWNPPGPPPPPPTPAGPRPSNIALKLPDPQAVTNAQPLLAGSLWRSSTLNFGLTYNPNVWLLESQTPTSVVLSTWQGQIHVAVEGFDPSTA